MSTVKETDAFAVPTIFDADEQVGFAPYWTPGEGKLLVARVVAKEEAADKRDFTRYLLQAGAVLICHRGAAAEAEEVEVKKGEMFTISVYYSLQGLFDFYLENGFKPWMQVESVKEVPTKTPGQTVWTWKLKVNKKDKAIADGIRNKLMLAAKQAPAKLAEGSAS